MKRLLPLLAVLPLAACGAHSTASHTRTASHICFTAPSGSTLCDQAADSYCQQLPLADICPPYKLAKNALSEEALSVTLHDDKLLGEFRRILVEAERQGVYLR